MVVMCTNIVDENENDSPLYSVEIVTPTPCVFFPPIAPDVCYQVLLRADYDTIVAAQQAFPGFAHLTDEFFWLDKCLMEGVTVPPREWRQLMRVEGVELNYEDVYRFRPFDLKMLDVSNGSFSLSAMGCERDPDNVPDESVDASFKTTPQGGEKTVGVRLSHWGITDSIMDRVRPIITVSELHCLVEGSISGYELHAKLLRPNELMGRSVVSSRASSAGAALVRRNYPLGYHRDSDNAWCQETLTLENYPSGMRKIGVLSRGGSLSGSRTRFAKLTIHISFPDVVVVRDADDQTQQMSSIFAHPLSGKPPAGLRRLSSRQLR